MRCRKRRNKVFDVSEESTNFGNFGKVYFRASCIYKNLGKTKQQVLKNPKKKKTV
jgi:hypothetical protein